MTKIAVLVGSLREGSLNKKLAKEIEQIVPDDVEFDYIDIDLPLYNTDLESNFPTEVQTQKDKLAAADGVLFVTPEYNRGVPGVLKNAIDWISRPNGANSFDGKPAATIGITGSMLSTAIAQEHLHTSMIHLNMKILGQPEMFMNTGHVYGTDGAIIPETVQYLQAFMQKFVVHIKEN